MAFLSQHDGAKKVKLAAANFLNKTLSLILYRVSKSLTTKKIRLHGHAIAVSYDFFSLILAWALSCWIFMMPDIMALSSIDRLTFTNHYWKAATSGLILMIPIQLILFRVCGLYRGFWRFASIQDLRKILYSALSGGVFAWAILHITHLESTLNAALPVWPTAFLYSLFLAAFLSSARLFVRLTKDYKHHYGEFQRVIIVGAGDAGESLVRDLLRSENRYYKPVAFIDDDLLKRGREIHGVRVVGTITELPALISKYDIDLVLIAIPSASSANMRSVVEECEKANIRCYTLPGVKDLANGRVSINVLRSISLEDLLGRYPVTCQWTAIKTHLQNKTILVTGGGGSIGSELCRQLLQLSDIAELIIVDNNEYNLYSIDMELRKKFPDRTLHTELLSITDRLGIQAVLKKYAPQLVFHAAAYKHVPLLENQPRTAIYNNIIGTNVIAEESLHANVETFVLISSDKAVNPTNIMGATKRAAEYFCQNLNYAAQKTRFITVRFGNVLDSAGSVVPLFRKQIESGGPVTVTHPDITRFFMTIPEASQLILQAAFLGQGGEIFVLDMGDPVKISYLAEQMIKLSGRTVGKDIQIIYSGLRPGEKLYEECFYTNETLQPTLNAKILQAQSQPRNLDEIMDICHHLETLCKAPIEPEIEHALLSLLNTLVPEYHPAHPRHHTKQSSTAACATDKQEMDA